MAKADAVLLPTVLMLFCSCATAGTGPSGATGAFDDALDDQLLYECHPGADAPHAKLRVLVVRDSEQQVSAPKKGAAATVEDVAVVFEVNPMEESSEGHCFRHAPRHGGAPGPLTCEAFDGGLSLSWPAGGGGRVDVREAWLFGTKEYQADCDKKA